MPMTNAWGFFRSRFDLLSLLTPSRDENGIDVNRDFPFDPLQPSLPCLQSETSRAIQALYAHSLLAATVTFHGGMRSITYEWGDFHNHARKALAPDFAAMHAVATLMNQLSGRWYAVGTSNDVVYPVHGGMEEWGYAASWFDRLAAASTVPARCAGNRSVVLAPASNRCVTFLVETTDVKTPPQPQLGDTEHLFHGEVPRKGQFVPIVMRQALAVVETLRPYSIMGPIRVENGTVEVRWTVGGCFEVDMTKVVAIPSTPQLEGIVDVGQNRGDLSDAEYALLSAALNTTHLAETPSLKRPSPLHQNLSSLNLADDRNRAHFNASLALAPGRYLLVVVSRVDAFLQVPPAKAHPAVAPQSLFVQLRTDAVYRSGERVLRGRPVVLSRPVLVSLCGEPVRDDVVVALPALLRLPSSLPSLPVVSGWWLIVMNVACLLFLLCLLFSLCSTNTEGVSVLQEEQRVANVVRVGHARRFGLQIGGRVEEGFLRISIAPITHIINRGEKTVVVVDAVQADPLLADRVLRDDVVVDGDLVRHRRIATEVEALLPLVVVLVGEGGQHIRRIILSGLLRGLLHATLFLLHNGGQ